MNYIRKATAGILCAVMICSGCQKQTTVSEAKESKTIRIWTWDDTFNVKAAQMAAEKYKKTHKDADIMIEIKENEEIIFDVENMLAAKMYQNLPDIIMIEDYDAQGVLTRYEEEFTELTEKIDPEYFVDYKKEICSRNGKLYGIPFDSGVAALFYRLDIMEDAGYTQQDMQDLTWDEYIEIGKEVYKRTGAAMLTLDPTDLPLVRLIMQSEGEWYVDHDGTTVTIDENKSLKKALEILKKMLQEQTGISAVGWNDFISAFQKGEVATVVNGSWIISSIKSNESQAGQWRAAPVPKLKEGDQTLISNVGGSSWYLLKHASQSIEAEAFALSMFVEDTEFMDQLINEIGIIPAVNHPENYKNYWTADSFFGEEQVTKFLSDMVKEIPVVNYGSKSYEIEGILEEEFQNILINGEIEECLKEAQIKAEAVAKG
ncbi:MAG: ABC transporter substrate-binding protein [Blautia sp.]